MKYHVEFDIDFRRNSYGGRYIAFEGIDGSGKTHQVERLYEHFKKSGEDVVVTREPRKSGGMIEDLIGKVLLGEAKISPVAFQYLVSADRFMNQEEVVVPALKEGKIVISDRSFWSVVPYAVADMEGIRGVGAQIPLTPFNKGGSEWVEDGWQVMAAQGLLSMYHRFVVPDVTVFLDVSVGVAWERLQGKVDEVEIYEKRRSKLERVMQGYEWLIKEFPGEFCVIDGNRNIAEVGESVVKRLEWM